MSSLAHRPDSHLIEPRAHVPHNPLQIRSAVVAACYGSRMAPKKLTKAEKDARTSNPKLKGRAAGEAVERAAGKVKLSRRIDVVRLLRG